jgi:nitrile hydratase
VDSIADMGGTEGWGHLQPPRDEPVFAEPWQGRAFALAILSVRVSRQNIDAFRHAQERLSRASYLDDGYFGRWLNAAAAVPEMRSLHAPEPWRSAPRAMTTTMITTTRADARRPEPLTGAQPNGQRH